MNAITFRDNFSRLMVISVPLSMLILFKIRFKCNMNMKKKILDLQTS